MSYVASHNESFLLKRLAQNDSDAFTSIYNTYRPLLLHYSLQLLKTKALAEDVCNEVFLNLWQNRHALSNVESLRAYLLTSCRNRGINALKAAARSQKRKQELVNFFKSASIDAEAEHLDKEYIAFIRKQVDGLPPRSRQVFYLCREEGYSYSEVSLQLGISRNAVKNHMVYSIKKLKAVAEKCLGISLVFLLFVFKLF